jgi:hypothetical protein
LKVGLAKLTYPSLLPEIPMLLESGHPIRNFFAAQESNNLEGIYLRMTANPLIRERKSFRQVE